MKKQLLFTALCCLQFLTFNSFAQTQIGQDIDGEAANDRSGESVSMPDAYTVAIGAYGNDGTGSDAGHVRIYTWNGNAWLQEGMDIDGEAGGDRSGSSVSMPDAYTVAIGALLNDGTDTSAGHVRIYTWNPAGGGTWVQKGADIDGEAAGDLSGHSVNMPDANTVAIGAPYNDGTDSAAGHVRVYTWAGSAWLQKGMDIDGEAGGDYSGWSVSMPDSNTLAIGAPGNGGTGSEAGHVRIYTWNPAGGGTWLQKGADIDGEAGDGSGSSVSMPDANTVAIGAPWNDAGHVRIYTWNGSAWLQKGMDINGEAAHDQSGESVSMPDTNTVAIGAGGNDETDVNAGHVRVYTWNGSVWLQKGMDIDGEAAYDGSGSPISMPDTNTVAIGAPGNGGPGTEAGHVRVYDLLCATLDDSVGVSGATLTAGESGATYQWIDCDNGNTPISGETNRSFTATENGNYAVMVTTQNGCTDTSDCSAVTGIGMSEQTSGRKLRIHPNPAKNVITVDVGTHETDFNSLNINIYNSTGKLVMQETVRLPAAVVNISGLPPGLYNILLQNGHTLLEATKMIKQ